MYKIICLYILLFIISSTKQFDLETCRYPIGIETGKILDSAFSSSSYAQINTIASKARIRSETNGWCPLNKISSTTYEYIQIDLINLTVITLIELQGKFSLKPNEQYADAFRIEYKREEEQKWIKYKDFSGQYILNGNSNSYIPTIRDISPPIIARQIRVIPIVIGSISKYVCMRLELYGCYYQDGLISYSIPQGDKRGYDIQFFDETYDGQNENGILKDGLGQLTDGILGHDDYHLTDNIQIGYEWIGWKKNSSNIKLTFYFDTIRNFTSIRIHTSNLFTYDIYLFYSITILNCYNINNKKNFIISNDYINTSARFIYISLLDNTNIISNCLNIILTFNNRSKWILISEIQFDSISIKSIDNHISTSIIHYWNWLIFPLSLLIIFIILSVFIYIHRIQIYKKHNNFYNIKNHRIISQIDCCINKTNTSYTPSISNNSDINPYLITTSNDTSKMIINPYSSIDMYTNSQSDSENIIKNIQGLCGNSLYESLSSSSKNFQSKFIQKIDDKQLIIGQNYSIIDEYFGMIFHGYIYPDQSYKILKPVLIKILINNNKNQKELFYKEHELLNHLNHPNLVQFYGYTIKQNYALIEHSDFGDVYTYLLTFKNISKTIRLYIITQLSNALYYLESHEIIHRDIAARNCLIYPNYKIKLTNSAIASEQFQLHYYKIDHIRLPIRWMAPECILNNQFTLQSDIWAFGITYWEIMTNCITLPYYLLNNEEVYQRLKLMKDLILYKPEYLNKEFIDLMLECWRPYNERPTFEKIYIFFNKYIHQININ